MAYRGRGGGRGGFGGRGHHAKEDPFVPFPDIQLPDAGGILSELDQKKNKGLKEEETLIRDTLNWLMKSEYNLDKTDRQDKDAEVSESTKRKAKRAIESFSQYLVPSMFPAELTRGSNVQQVSRENVKWNKRDTEKNSDERLWDLIEKREKNSDAKKEKEGEKDEEEDEDADADAEEEENDESDDDYNQNIYFDDDEDDFNVDDGGDDEPILDMDD